MNSNKSHEILLEMLRVGLISIRNLASQERRNSKSELMLLEWAQLCHSLPSVLMGECDNRAVAFFCNGDGLIFRRNYPSKEDADFLQVIALLDELEPVART